MATVKPAFLRVDEKKAVGTVPLLIVLSDKVDIMLLVDLCVTLLDHVLVLLVHLKNNVLLGGHGLEFRYTCVYVCTCTCSFPHKSFADC